MKLHILNDLHVEFDDFFVPETDADVVILAGDIGVGTGGIDWAAVRIPNKPVIYVAGNHEFYHHEIELIEQLKSQAAEHVHVLDNDEVIIDGTRFLGCTLWTDFLLDGVVAEFTAMRFAKACMPDFRVVKMNGERFEPRDSVSIHNHSRQWIADRLDETFAGETVVVTHHAPSLKSLHPDFVGNELNPAFMSRMEHLMGGDRVRLWVHGHTHNSFDYDIEGTRVVCNPRGYSPKALNPEFHSDLVVEI